VIKLCTGMATYKVLQDIEAEDKFVGPFTFKQFGFAMVGVFFAFLNFTVVARGAPWAAAFFTPPMALGFFLAWPWSKDQPTEVWLLARIRFKFMPKLRIWDQSGLEELVTITAPKKEEKQLTNNIGQAEVESRLKALAETIDSRGWAIKHAEINNSLGDPLISDRLISPSTLPQEVPTLDSSGIRDVLDEGTPVANSFDHMIEQSEQMRLQQNLDRLDKIRKGEPVDDSRQPEIRFTPPPTNYDTPFAQVPNAPVDEEQRLANELRARKSVGGISNKRLHTIGRYNPYAVEPARAKAQASMPTPSTPAILDLAQNNDLNVDTIARQAKKAKKAGGDEIVISLR
jgi:hypothetical protein